MNHCNASKLKSLAVILLFALTSQTAAAQSGQQETIRRFAFIAASNDGGPSRAQLRFAHTDAKAFARVMRQLGGVANHDSVLLLGPDRFDFEAGLARMRNLLERAKTRGLRLELVFYYSGHSDEQGLMLGSDLITYRELREAIGELPADVRIAILDSCSSGALTRSKGGTRRPPFLMDSSVDVKGYAFLTSSSADETAQESDRVGGSFFTHYLVSGLRGAADTSKDNKITLNEAYQYAFNETLARTESTQAGPQHPNYDFQLKGSGDLVLTDLRGTSALLVLPQSMEGRLFIRNRKGELAAEINKPAGSPINIGLEPGRYEITMDADGGMKKGVVTLEGGSKTELTLAMLSGVSKEKTVSRGDEPGNHKQDDEPEKIVRRPFSVGLVPGLTTDGGADAKTVNSFSLNFIGWGDYLTGFELGVVGNIRKERVIGGQLAGIFNFSLSEIRGFQGAGIFNFSAGSHLGFKGAGIANVVHGPMKGFEGAGILNANTNGSAIGFQGAGIANFNNGDAHGFQGAGILNVNRGTFRGLQGASIANVSATGDSRGAQLAGITNYANIIDGVQVAGIANAAAREMTGLQLGLINWGGEVRGAQVGLINISRKMKGAPVGLINAVGDGILAPTLWYSDTSEINLALKMGSRYWYSILGWGAHPSGGEDERGDSLIFGMGAHFELPVVWLEIDLLSHWLRSNFDWSPNDLDVVHKARTVVGWRVLRQLSLFIGPTLNLLMSESRDKVGFMPTVWSRDINDDTRMYMSVGFVAGLQFEPPWGNLNSQGD